MSDPVPPPSPPQSTSEEDAATTYRRLPRERLEDFDAHPWCRAILNDPTVTKTMLRQMPPPFDTSVSNSLFTKTFFTDDAIRAFVSLYRPLPGTTSAGEGEGGGTGGGEIEPGKGESLLLISLGKSIDGGLRRLHGGVIATLLDQVMGIHISYAYGMSSATAELDVRFRRKIDTPCVVLCRARIEKVKGRWIELVGSVEDGLGTVYAEGRGGFVRNREASDGEKAKM
ncbi:hypothetical protein BU24DRAFT_468453 [Aaosphaeria arxii CBS 175.79]|uniref:Thioesterase domain-containing protein n=1 Tax=Aaosphaeria arxii CBS 175.79 TaxID=1450172 RepID=A0A6A5X823_9PLEO|nr:uncharacterized protein BU24DRAFT_468453 [Aaosphaeria arxii CBS 175.79]KAF2009056.1 hypothetical protein BU24DRAFT_468453 [Aaosphaeria arxii CBS 175.79]